MKTAFLAVLFSVLFALTIATVPLTMTPVSANGAIERVISPADRRTLTHDIATGPDSSVNVIWVDNGPAGAAPPGSAPRDHARDQVSAGPSRGHGGKNDLYFARSIDGGVNFSAPLRINDIGNEVRGSANSRPRIAIGKTGTIHVWWPSYRYLSDDKPTVIDSRYTRSTDGGRTFEPARTLNSDTDRDTHNMDHMGVRAEHAFGSLAVGPDGRVSAFWIDSRDKAANSNVAAMYMRVSNDDGKTFEPDRRVIAEGICPCCQINAIVSATGKIFVSWRHVFTNGSRTSVVASSTDGGQTWGAPVRVTARDWLIDACPLKPASLATDNAGRLYVSWFAGEEKPAGVYFAVSMDGGTTFAAPVLMHREAQVSDHAQLAVDNRGTVVAMWDAKAGGQKRVFMRVSRDNGRTFGLVREFKTAAEATWPTVAFDGKNRMRVTWLENNQLMFRGFSQMLARN
ncbi:MAG: sialidase family protein [Blastocatellia bacterium]